MGTTPWRELYDEDREEGADALTPEEMENREKFLRWKLQQPPMIEELNDEDGEDMDEDRYPEEFYQEPYIPTEDDERLLREDMKNPQIWPEQPPPEDEEESDSEINYDDIPF